MSLLFSSVHLLSLPSALGKTVYKQTVKTHVHTSAIVYKLSST